MPKYIGEVYESTPVEVKTVLDKINSPYVKGMILVNCPELGFYGTQYIPCRYGLSVPYYKAKKGDKLWIEPTFEDKSRWVYTGFVDCGDEVIDPAAEDVVGLFPFEDGIFKLEVGEEAGITIDTITKFIDIYIGDSHIKIEEDKVSINGTNLVVEV